MVDVCSSTAAILLLLLFIIVIISVHYYAVNKLSTPKIPFLSASPGIRDSEKQLDRGSQDCNP